MSEGIRITLTRSRIGTSPRQREVLQGLGLRRMQSSVVRADTPAIRGMIFKVRHLVTVEAVRGQTGDGHEAA